MDISNAIANALTQLDTARASLAELQDLQVERARLQTEIASLQDKHHQLSQQDTLMTSSAGINTQETEDDSCGEVENDFVFDNVSFVAEQQQRQKHAATAKDNCTMSTNSSSTKTKSLSSSSSRRRRSRVSKMILYSTMFLSWRINNTKPTSRKIIALCRPSHRAPKRILHHHHAVTAVESRSISLIHPRNGVV